LWEIVNAHSVDHPFHLHSHRVQVLDVDGRPPSHAVWLDTVNVRGGQTVLLAVPLTGARAAPSTTATSPRTRTSG
jgi:FtsP/CotA-like multicopper oxidase with cupredoxin domain